MFATIATPKEVASRFTLTAGQTRVPLAAVNDKFLIEHQPGIGTDLLRISGEAAVRLGGAAEGTLVYPLELVSTTDPFREEREESKRVPVLSVADSRFPSDCCHGAISYLVPSEHFVPLTEALTVSPDKSQLLDRGALVLNGTIEEQLSCLAGVARSFRAARFATLPSSEVSVRPIASGEVETFGDMLDCPSKSDVVEFLLNVEDAQVAKGAERKSNSKGKTLSEVLSEWDGSPSRVVDAYGFGEILIHESGRREGHYHLGVACDLSKEELLKCGNVQTTFSTAQQRFELPEITDGVFVFSVKELVGSKLPTSVLDECTETLGRGNNWSKNVQLGGVEYRLALGVISEPPGSDVCPLRAALGDGKVALDYSLLPRGVKPKLWINLSDPISSNGEFLRPDIEQAAAALKELVS